MQNTSRVRTYRITLGGRVLAWAFSTCNNIHTCHGRTIDQTRIVRLDKLTRQLLATRSGEITPAEYFRRRLEVGRRSAYRLHRACLGLKPTNGQDNRWWQQNDHMRETLRYVFTLLFTILCNKLCVTGGRRSKKITTWLLCTSGRNCSVLSQPVTEARWPN